MQMRDDAHHEHQQSEPQQSEPCDPGEPKRAAVHATDDKDRDDDESRKEKSPLQRQAVIDPTLEDKPRQSAYKFEPVNPYPPNFTQQPPSPTPQRSPKEMPGRVEPYPRHRPQQQRRPSPPPIATLGGPRTPPPYYPPSAYQPYPPPPPPHHGGYYDLPPSHPSSLHHMHHPHAAAYPPPPHPSSIVYTEDASTKLSDRVRRRCFNCCTTDTSTWRRSNLSPGKVLCNKCGLFERTHSRPRPEQFPHKRGPLSGGALSQQRGPDPGAYMMRGTPTHTPPSMTHPLPPPPPPSMYPGTTLPPFSNVEKRPYTPHTYASREPSPPDWNTGERQHWTPPPSLVKDEPSKETDEPEKTAVSV